MPFDAAITPTRATLHEAVQHLGITPIPLDDLNRHKQAELAKHPASWMYRYADAIRLALVVSFLTGAVLAVGGAIAEALLRSDGVPLASPWEMFAIVACVGGTTLTLLIVLTMPKLSNIPVKGPAGWRETWVFQIRPPHGIPHRIADLATDLMDRVPHAKLVLGELWQSETLLDPYLIVKCDGEEVVLGIWNDQGVIQQASRCHLDDDHGV